MAQDQEVAVLLLEVGRALSSKNEGTVRAAIASLQQVLDQLKTAEDAEEQGEQAQESAVSEAAVSPDHGPMTGEHSHPHPAYGSQGGDEIHAHMHSHANDAAHQHEHADMPPSQDKTPTVEAVTPDESNLQEVQLLEYAPLVRAES